MEARFEMASNCLKALAHPIRIKILACLKTGKKNVGEIEDYCGEYTQSNISQHLAIMKSKGIIKSKRDGNQVFYDVSEKDLYKALDLIAKLFCKK